MAADTKDNLEIHSNMGWELRGSQTVRLMWEITQKIDPMVKDNITGATEIIIKEISAMVCAMARGTSDKAKPISSIGVSIIMIRSVVLGKLTMETGFFMEEILKIILGTVMES